MRQIWRRVLLWIDRKCRENMIVRKRAEKCACVRERGMQQARLCFRVICYHPGNSSFQLNVIFPEKRRSLITTIGNSIRSSPVGIILKMQKAIPRRTDRSKKHSTLLRGSFNSLQVQPLNQGVSLLWRVETIV